MSGPLGPVPSESRSSRPRLMPPSCGFPSFRFVCRLRFFGKKGGFRRSVRARQGSGFSIQVLVFVCQLFNRRQFKSRYMSFLPVANVTVRSGAFRSEGFRRAGTGRSVALSGRIRYERCTLRSIRSRKSGEPDGISKTDDDEYEDE